LPPTPEDEAREKIDQLLQQAGWQVQDAGTADIHAAKGVAIRKFPLLSGFGFADYLLYVKSKAAGVIETKRINDILFKFTEELIIRQLLFNIGWKNKNCRNGK
jgi:type I restriction enzyme R subunit